MQPATRRSRAYPVLSLEDGKVAMDDILERLGSGSFSREVLAEVLGHSNARGGPGARKIAALTQYRLLSRKAGRYSPTALAASIVHSRGELQQRMALLQALRSPPLFAALLDRYEPQGHLPERLEGILWRDHGITKKASHLAAETFRRSARYAGVLDEQGALRSLEPVGFQQRGEPPSGDPAPRRGAGSGRFTKRADGSLRDETEQRFEFALTAGKAARICLPLELCRRDLDIVKKQIEFLEYQIADED